MRRRTESLIRMIRNIEREVLVKGYIPGKYVKRVNEVHRTFISQAERSMVNLRIHNNVAGAVFTVGDMSYATNKSIQEGSVRPIAAESIRQAGGWGLGWAGMKVGCAAGALAGIETGPGAFVTCAIGGAIGGVAGYFGADWVADMIYENEDGLPWLNPENW